MTPLRKRLATTLLAGLLGLHLLHIAWDREHWPISHYPMYSNVDLSQTTDKLRAVLVMSDGHEVPLTLEAMYPFDPARLTFALRGLERAGDAEATRAALTDLLARHNSRAADAGTAPAAGIRLYDMLWTLRPDAANAATPDRRTLIAEVQLDG